MNANSTLIVARILLVFGCQERESSLVEFMTDLPEPSNIKSSYKHFILHTGINDLRATNPVPIQVLANELQKKCTSYTEQFPRSKIHISLLLPTKDIALNNLVCQFNHLMVQFSYNYKNIIIIDHSNLCGPSGTLLPFYGRHLKDGNTKDFDSVHLGNKGIPMFSMNIKKHVVKINPANGPATKSSTYPVKELNPNNYFPDNYSKGLLYNNDPFPGINANRNVFPHFNTLSIPPALPPPTAFTSQAGNLGPSLLFPPLPVRNSPSFVGDYHGAVCSSFQLNKHNDGYQT